MRCIGIGLDDEKRSRATTETRAANVTLPSYLSGEALARIKTELAEPQGRVRRLTFELGNEKKKVKVPASQTPGAHPM